MDPCRPSTEGFPPLSGHYGTTASTRGLIQRVRLVRARTTRRREAHLEHMARYTTRVRLAVGARGRGAKGRGERCVVPATSTGRVRRSAVSFWPSLAQRPNPIGGLLRSQGYAGQEATDSGPCRRAGRTPVARSGSVASEVLEERPRSADPRLGVPGRPTWRGAPIRYGSCWSRGRYSTSWCACLCPRSSTGSPVSPLRARIHPRVHVFARVRRKGPLSTACFPGGPLYGREGMRQSGHRTVKRVLTCALAVHLFLFTGFVHTLHTCCPPDLRCHGGCTCNHGGCSAGCVTCRAEELGGHSHGLAARPVASPARGRHGVHHHHGPCPACVLLALAKTSHVPVQIWLAPPTMARRLPASRTGIRLPRPTLIDILPRAPPIHAVV